MKYTPIKIELKPEQKGKDGLWYLTFRGIITASPSQTFLFHVPYEEFKLEDFLSNFAEIKSIKIDLS